MIDHENKAVTISAFELTLIPGLLQTGGYAHAVISRIATVPAVEVDERVAARLARQCLLNRERPPQFTFYVHEFALRLQVGGATVMSAQLHHLLRMSVRPYLTLRVVPASFGAHAATAGAFKLRSSPSSSRWSTWRARPAACSWRNGRRSPPTVVSWRHWRTPRWERENREN